MSKNYQPSTETKSGSNSGVPALLANDVTSTAAAMVERVLTELTGHIYSPRIRLLTIDQVSEATNIGKSTIYKLMDEGRFPKPQRELGKNLWRESALIAWADHNDPNGDH